MAWCHLATSLWMKQCWLSSYLVLMLHIFIKTKQGKSEGFDSCDRPSNLTQIGFKPSIFQPVWPWNLMDDPKKTIEHLFYATLSFLHHFIAIGEFKLDYSPETPNLGQNRLFFSCVTLKFDGWPWTRQIWGIWKLRLAYSPETPNLGQNRWCFVPCDLEI